MGWVTLDDGQHVYIGSGGKVLATRGAISSVSGGGERGRALAERSKAAIGKATGRTQRAIEHAKTAAVGPTLPSRKIGMAAYNIHPAKAIQAGVPEAVSSTRFHDPSGRTYINVHTNDKFRGDERLKLYIEPKTGALVHEHGGGLMSPRAQRDRDAVLDHARKVGIRVEDRKIRY